jgi:hypothetical protein
LADGPEAGVLAPPTAPRASLECGWEVRGGRKVMKVIWCWRCKRDIPMMEPDEVNQVFGLQNRGLPTLDPESFRRIKEEFADDPDGLQRRLEFEREYGGMLREYQRITGFPETNPTALNHHQVALYGSPCRRCGKPLRTPQARICGACMSSV